MERRDLLKGLVVLGLCPLCARQVLATEASHHWSYQGETGPEHWGTLAKENAACSVGSQQSPLNITGAKKADVPEIVTDWKKGAAKIVNNGHTIQVNMRAGSTLKRGDKTFELVQFHFHAPSEHLVEGKSFPMEAHFVHKDIAGNDLGVLGVFLVPGKSNAAFASLADSFPKEEGQEAAVDVDPTALRPAKLKYWAYEGSLTTPPCSEIVHWMVAMEPVEVAAADINKFTALYPKNARPVLSAKGRSILSSE